jgi:HNH endonuclease
LECLFHFHCGRTTASNEHVFPAALGGRRTDRRLLCDACQQGWTSELDTVLPEQFRLLNLHLGVVGDHASKPARVSITDADTGNQLLIDEKMKVEGRGRALLSEDVADDGYTVRRYDFMSEAEERRALEELRTDGIKVDVLKRTATPLLRTKPLTSKLELGGLKAMRAAARIALNFLATREPDTARAVELERFKRWILSGPADDNTNSPANFGEELPSPFRVPNQFEYGHRVMLGLDPIDGIFARVSLFDAVEIAFRVSAATSGARRYYVWDVDPTARIQKPDLDRSERDLVGILEHSPRVLGEFATTSGAVYDKVQAGYDRILGAARARIDREHAEQLSRHLSQLSTVPRDRLPERVRRRMLEELQCATNLVARVAPLLEEESRDHGYAWTADYLHALMDAEVAEFIVPLSESVLGEVASVAVVLVEQNEATPDRVADLLFGLSGLRIAYLALFRRLKSMQIWFKADRSESQNVS